ncbi:MAG: TrmB family transcriptional regulator [Candidatus Bathyarchaeales archaeon]
MTEHIDKFEVLRRLGLTYNECKIFTALSAIGPATVKTISKHAQIARETVYRILPKIEKKGLIETILTTPKKFKAIPMEEALKILLENKTRELAHTKAKVKWLIRTSIEENKKASTSKDEPMFIIIPQKLIIKRLKEAMERVQKQIDVYTTWKRFHQGVTNFFSEEIKRILAKNVKLRIITEKPEKQDTKIEYVIKELARTQNIQIKFTQNHPKTVVGIYDQKEIFIITDPEASLNKASALWSNNQSIISLAQQFFENLWITPENFCNTHYEKYLSL